MKTPYWQVFAVDAKERTIADCGHRHATKRRAVNCLWTPNPWPDDVGLHVGVVRPC